MLARLFVIVGGLVVLVLATALIGPYFVDWTSYRSQFEAEAGRIIGRPVRVAGQATARLLPFPSVTFGDVRVGDPTDPDIRIATFSMDAELAPLLSGNLLIFDMRLDAPRVMLTLDENGLSGWDGATADAVEAAQVRLERVSVTGGEIILINRATGRMLELTGINGTLAADSLAGPWRAEGRLIANGAVFAVSGSTGVADATGATRVRTRLEPALLPVAIETEGTFAFADALPTYAGQFTATTGSGDAEEARNGLPDFRTLQVSGEFALSPSLLQVGSYRATAGEAAAPYIVNGLATLDFGAEPSFAFGANGAQLRIEQPEGGDTGVAGHLADLASRLAALPVPGIPGTVNVSLPAFVVGQTVIRDIAIAGGPEDGRWRLDRVEADLPGRTTLEASGLLASGDSFGFEGDLLVASRQPSGLAAWLVGDVDESIRKLPAAGFSANVDLTPEMQVFEGLELVLGEASYTGRAQRTSGGTEPPALAVELAAGELGEDDLRALSALFVDDQAKARAGQNLSLRLQAGPVSAAGFSAAALDGSASLVGSQLTVTTLAMEGVDGADIVASGAVDTAGAAPVASGEVRITASDPVPLLDRIAGLRPDDAVMRWLALTGASNPGLLEGVDLKFVGTAKSGTLPELSGSLNGVAGEMAVNATVVASRATQDADFRIVLNGTASAPRPAPVLALLGVAAADNGMDEPLQAALALNGDAGGGFDGNLVLESTDARFAAIGRAGMDGDGLVLDGQIEARASEIDPWLEMTGYALPGTGFGLPFEAKTGARLGAGIWTFDDLAGSLDGNAFSGRLVLQDTSQRRSVSGKLSLDSIDLAFLASLATGSTESLLSATDGWSAEPFGAPLLPGHAIDLALTAKTGEAGPLGPATSIGARVRYDDDKLSLVDLSAATEAGRLNATADFQNAGGAGLASAEFRIVDMPVGTIFDGVQGRASVSGSISATGDSPASMVTSAAGSGIVTLTGASLPRLDPAALPGILEAADTIGFGITPDQIRSIAAREVERSSFGPFTFEAPFSLAGGIARIANVSVMDGGGTLSGDLAIDLSALSVSGSAGLAYDAGPDSVVGASPDVRLTLLGPFSQPTVTLDYQALEAFVTQRALEREQARVEAMQAKLLEKQRLRREAQAVRLRERQSVEAARRRIELIERDRQIELYRSEEFRKSL